MKTKELKNLAKQMAQCEYVMQHSSDKKDRANAEAQMTSLWLRIMTEKVNPDEFDDYVREFFEKLEKNS